MTPRARRARLLNIQGPIVASNVADAENLDHVSRASTAIAVWTIASRVTGFMRTLVVAAVLGPTFFANLYQAANTLPNLLYELSVGSLVVSLLVPPLVKHIDIDRDVARAGRIADGFLGICMLLFSAGALVIVAGAPIVLRLLGAGIDDPTVLADQRRVGWPMLALLVPQTALYGIVGVSAAYQNAHRRFALTAMAPVAENLGVMAVLIIFMGMYGTGIDLDQVGLGGVLLLGGGSTMAVAAHAMVQWLAARRLGHSLVPRAGWRDPDVRAIVRLALPSLGYASMNALRIVVMLIGAGSVAGGVVAFQFAYNFYSLPGAMISRPISVASLPELAKMSTQQGLASFRSLYTTGQQIAVFLLAPCTIALVILATPLSRALSFGAMNSESGRALLGISIAGIALGIIGDGRFILASSASYARRHAIAPMRTMVLRTSITVVFTALAFLFSGSAVLGMIALGSSIADLIAGQLLHLRIISALRSLPTRRAPFSWIPFRFIGVIGVTVAVGVAMRAITTSILDISSSGARVQQFIALGIIAVAVAATYILASTLLQPAGIQALLSWRRNGPETAGGQP